MKKKNQEITDRKIIEEILLNATVCRIAMNDSDVPYLLPFNYGYRDNFIYIHSAPEGKKIELLTKNGKVCFEIEREAEVVKYDQACQWTAFYRSVIGYGEIEIIDDFHEKVAGLEIIMDQHGAKGKPEFAAKQVDAMVILRLKIRSITGKQSGNWDKILEKNRYETESARLFIKEVEPDDLENIHRLESYPEVDEFNTLGLPENIEVTKESLNSMIEQQQKLVRKSYTWKIVLKDSNEFIGLAGMTLSFDKFRLGEIYYKLLPSHWGNGYATEVSKLLIRSGFNDFHLHKVEAGVATDNIRSIRVLEKSGMTREGLRRKILPIRGEWRDNYHYAIVEDDPVDF